MSLKWETKKRLKRQKTSWHCSISVPSRLNKLYHWIYSLSLPFNNGTRINIVLFCRCHSNLYYYYYYYYYVLCIIMIQDTTTSELWCLTLKLLFYFDPQHFIMYYYYYYYCWEHKKSVLRIITTAAEYTPMIPYMVISRERPYRFRIFIG